MKYAVRCARLHAVFFFFRTRLRRASCFKQSLTARDSRARRSASHCASSLSVSHCFSRTGGREASGLRRNRRWGLDHSRRGGGDRAPRTHLKDALPRATARPVEIQQRACGIEASGFSIHVWLCARKPVTIWHSVSTQHHFTDGRIGKEEWAVSLLANIQSKSVCFLLNMLLINAITAALRVSCVPPEASCTVIHC